MPAGCTSRTAPDISNPGGRRLPPERHVGYAFQWWGLALAALVVMWLGGRRLAQDRRPSSPAQEE